MHKSRKAADAVTKKQPVERALQPKDEQRGPAPLDPRLLPQVGGGYRAPKSGW